MTPRPGKPAPSKTPMPVPSPEKVEGMKEKGPGYTVQSRAKAKLKQPKGLSIFILAQPQGKRKGKTMIKELSFIKDYKPERPAPKKIHVKAFSLKVVKEKPIKYATTIGRRVNSPAVIQAAAVEGLELHEEPDEVFAILMLDTKNNITAISEVSRGTLNASIVHPRDVFKRAILQNANAIILLHNHPSGDPKPSNEDINITKRLVEAGNLLGIKVLDHVIIGNESRYTSFKEENLI